MKLSLAFFVLSAAAPGAAFTVQAPNSANTALYSFSYGNVDGQGASGPPSAPLQAERGSGAGPQPQSRAPPPPPGAGGAAPPKKTANTYSSQISDLIMHKDNLDMENAVTVQGGSLRTYSFGDPFVERAQLLLKTEGRPLNANIELWHGPDNTPQKMAIYSEDGDLRPVSLIIETPRSDNAVCIRNTGHLEFPLLAWVDPDTESSTNPKAGVVTKLLSANSTPRTIQGGALHTYPFDPHVTSVQLLIKTDGRPLNARIELMQGPNNNKQVMEIYTEDGMERPFFSIIETPGTGNVVRVVNTATVEFPMYACVEPFIVESSGEGAGAKGWDNGGTNSFNRGWDNGAADNFKSQW